MIDQNFFNTFFNQQPNRGFNDPSMIELKKCPVCSTYYYPEKDMCKCETKKLKGEVNEKALD